MVAVLILQELEKCRSLYIHAVVTVSINIFYDRNLSEKQSCTTYDDEVINESAS